MFFASAQKWEDMHLIGWLERISLPLRIKLAGILDRMRWLVQRVSDVSKSTSALVPNQSRTGRDSKVQPQKKPQNKRGRPIEISAELKLQALQVRGTRERAKILYRTPYPSAQQVKNLSAILAHFKRTHFKTE